MPNLRRSLVCLAGAAVILSGCGGEPSKDEWVAKQKESMGADLTSTFESINVDAAKAEPIVDRFLGCVYDNIKDDEELLARTMDSEDSAITEKAAACSEQLTKEMTRAAAGGG